MWQLNSFSKLASFRHIEHAATVIGMVITNISFPTYSFTDRELKYNRFHTTSTGNVQVGESPPGWYPGIWMY